jgi:hypothetical protein
MKLFPATIVVASALALTCGCDISEAPESADGVNPQPANSLPDAQNNDVSRADKIKSSRKPIVSNGAITVLDGKVTYGKPKVDEEVEKQIHKTLSYHRNLANSIESKVPGGTNGSRQSREEFATLKKLFMGQYELSSTEIDAILEKGDKLGWK